MIVKVAYSKVTIRLYNMKNELLLIIDMCVVCVCVCVVFIMFIIEEVGKNDCNPVTLCVCVCVCVCVQYRCVNAVRTYVRRGSG